MKPNPNLIEGVDFTIGGRTYVAAPLTLGGIKALHSRLGGSAAEVVSAVLTVALRRNYPEISQPWMDETMEGAEFSAARAKLPELMRLSGLVEEDPPSGEARAAS